MEITTSNTKKKIYKYEEAKVSYQKGSNTAIYISDKRADNGHESLRAMFNRPAMKESPVRFHFLTDR